MKPSSRRTSGALQRIHRLRVHDGEQWHQMVVPHGMNLRWVLLAYGLSPYTALTRALNCGGNGLCATCGVCIDPPAPPPTHWHDRLADRFGYPRLSCQIAVTHDLTVRLLPDKWIWGRREQMPSRVQCPASNAPCPIPSVQ